MSKQVTRSSTSASTKIWENVERAAATTPRWMQQQVRAAAQQSAQNIHAKSEAKEKK